ncbi:PAS domain S-box-containing protein/diguanylate cyclase (GGDEF) domain-containing protein [Bradyrhizobium lablabi]|uniref:PAS domain S-box-containing protein/diguanylate cyclase (GGDEF) domain-containing protein n=1 Tax=Bradyrhizobium lablabi TaxID=722472 RepID=A0A1M6S068_9BRAD|nr:EAL domain-containing protein [Bradyrhizobium lablabi]SHK38212.1 PAS domain S-box-containing protein/diguanylate cyclase (GGDEF) domain-containing protein [Bradyrhizobium lablabi]
MIEAVVPKKALKAVRRWFYLGNAKTPVGSALLLEQFRILTTQVPVLYGVLIIDSISLAYVLSPSLPIWFRFGVPGILLLASVSRMTYWMRLRAVVPTAEQALNHLFRTRILASTMNAGFSLWTLALLEYVDPDMRAPVALLVFVGSVASAYCLGSFPSAARLTLLISALPISLRLMFTGEAPLVCIGLNLCLLLVPLIRMMNTSYRDLVNLVASRAELSAEGRRARTAEMIALKEQAKAREIASRFDLALNNMSQGLCFFDGEQRLIAYNRRYLDLYGLPPESVKPGMLLAEIVDLRFAAGSFPAMTQDEYLAWRNDLVASEEVHDTIVELANGRVFQICHRPMPDRGWVATHEDITERFHAEKALTEAKSNAERAEAAARAAHATLIDALDVVPEGLVILDKDDRYVLWNQRYAEAYGESLEAIAAGVSFEETLRFGLARGQYPEAEGCEEQWLRERLARHAQPQSTHEQQLPGDRWVRIEERRMSDGGSIGIRVDITDLKRREASFRLLFEENPLPMWVVDINTLELLAVNAATCRHYGYSREQMLSMTVKDLRVPEETERLHNEFRQNKGLQTGHETRRHVTADGRVIDVAIEARPLRYNDRDAAVAVAFDMTDRKRAEQRILHLACHDALTDLPNRAALDGQFSRALEGARQRNGNFAVLCIDFDRFKEINDLFGHSMGDKALREASTRLQVAAQGAFLARIGGDEFIAITEQDPLPSSAELLASRLRGALEAGIEIDGHCFDLDLSIGIAVYPRDGEDARSLFANADAALYRAKHEGRGVVRFFTPAMDQQLRDRRALERDLRSAVANGELFVEYQPQRHSDGEIIGFEALVRWHHPQRGIVPPAEFIPIAEESDLIIGIGEWVLRQACREAASWDDTLQVAVNVSAIQFRRGDLQQMVRTVLQETGIPPARLELEITEGVLIENLARAASMLNSLKILGIRIALDDFGTGYSSLSYLQSLPLDRIKIDRSFVASLGRTDRSLAIVRAVIGLAHGLGLPVLAEGVETKEQLRALIREGCDEMQGYLIGRPHPIEAYAEVVGSDQRRQKMLVRNSAL